jgi:hypothetical protein
MQPRRLNTGAPAQWVVGRQEGMLRKKEPKRPMSPRHATYADSADSCGQLKKRRLSAATNDATACHTDICVHEVGDADSADSCVPPTFRMRSRAARRSKTAGVGSGQEAGRGQWAGDSGQWAGRSGKEEAGESGQWAGARVWAVLMPDSCRQCAARSEKWETRKLASPDAPTLMSRRPQTTVSLRDTPIGVSRIPCCERTCAQRLRAVT